MKNIQVKLQTRPVGEPKASDFSIETQPIPEAIGEGQVLVKNIYISLDPAMRGWMNDARSYIPPVQLGEVMRAGTAGEVLASNHPDFQVGDFVTGNLGVQQFGVTDGKRLRKVNTNFLPLPVYLSTLGMPGMTAYFGLLDVGQPKTNETVVVSGAAGAVGSVVGQIAKIKGCRVVGIAGGVEKCRYLTETLGFDEAIDYKNEPVKAGLKRTCPKGIDVYFDNVGGETLDAVLARLNFKARVVLCGAISQYNATQPVQGPSNYLSLLVNRAKMEGMIVFDYAHRYHEAATAMAAWLAEGRLKTKEHIEVGIERFPEVLMQLFTGQKLGKLLLKVDE